MAKVPTADVRLGFWIAVGFFLFGVVLAVAQYLVSRARKAA